ncbi:AbiV family abortive infection protein [Rhizobium leguminosarum]|nr:AbiV family abortive infection protein [Rhizobium leguminosarum]
MRLFEDACALRKDRRYASATPLAILSLEEVGNFSHSRPKSCAYLRAEGVLGTFTGKSSGPQR